MAEWKEPLVLAPAKRPIFRGIDYIKWNAGLLPE